MAAYLITHEDEDGEAVYQIGEADSAQEVVRRASVGDHVYSVWTLRTAEPRRFKVVTETQTRIVAQ